MIQKLRKNFIIVAMCSTLLVLAVIIGIANAVNYLQIVEKADNLLQILADNNGEFPKDSLRHNKEFEKPEKWEKPGPDGVTAETPYETRFFSVQVNEEGEAVSIDTGNVAAVGTDEAADYAEAVYKNRNNKGFQNEYRYQIFAEDGTQLIIFVDCRRELDSFGTFAAASTASAAVGFLAVFLLVVIFSKKVFQPVADSYEKQKRFITDAGHELKTPLAVIAANVDVLELEGETNPWTESIRRQTERLAHLTEQLVSLSRMDESAQCQMTDFSISDAVKETLEPFELLAESQEKHLDLTVTGNITYHGNEDMIRQMVSLLADNAVKYSVKNDEIKVVLKKEGKHCILSVQNTAADVPQGNLNILFERFYRMDTSRSTDTGGSGIGLSIVKSIAEAHGGSVAAKSEDGKSIVIKVKL